jgi:hypothetical protein
MPQVVKLTGLAHGDIAKLETICPGNGVKIIREPKYDKPEGKAYKAICKDLIIGYIPLVPTLRAYYEEAYTAEAKARIGDWGEAVVKVREWLDSRVKYQFEESWDVRVKTLLYDHDGVHKPYDNGKVAAVSVEFTEAV